YKPDSNVEIKILGENFVLDGNKWIVSSDNLISLGKKAEIKNLQISRKNEVVLIQSREENTDMLRVDFKGFELSNLINLVEIEGDTSVFLNGNINGFLSMNLNSDKFS